VLLYLPNCEDFDRQQKDRWILLIYLLVPRVGILEK